jgi:hypothetical protein
MIVGVQKFEPLRFEYIIVIVNQYFNELKSKRF